MQAESGAERHLALLNAVSAATNEADDLATVMQRALELVCGLLGLSTGWVYLLEEETGEPTLFAASQLPPVFAIDPERWQGLCLCIQSLLENDPRGAANVNTLACSRLWEAVEGNPEGLRNHASIPFFSRGRQMGIMNVAHADWRTLSAGELALLTTVGNQLGLTVDRARLLEARAERAIQDERGRLARELHDTVMQRLTGIGLQIETADATIESDRERARARLQAALKLTREALAETRAAVDGLDPEGSGVEPLHRSLPELCSEFEQIYEIAVRCEVRTLPGRPGAPIEAGLYRIVREGLNNVVKHAGASRASVRVRQRPGRITLIIEDDGRGFDRARASAMVHGYGLHSMRRRAAMLGGRFRLRTAPGMGTRVEVSVPLGGPP